eukprot:snap_masked-scaffold1_size3401120-processed-gene-11.33 protein:Tk04882 transcript:snap_masked-scaffold1_size3401120-processed-gene-11.33-mRNA-1 annotation:"acetyl- acetyltransferase"
MAIAGGAESMSRAAYWAPSARWGARMGDAAMVDAMVGALHDPFENIHMGVTAENIAEKWGITREEQDALAVESHHRAAAAWEGNFFESQIVPVEMKTRKGVKVFDRDEHFRGDVDAAGMAKLRPVFKKDGSVTAGNASGLNDAASALVLATAEAAEARGLKPIARLIGYSHAGCEPEYMGIGPVPAVKKLLAQTGLTVADFDVFEVNEAFAAQAIAVCRDLGLPADKVNPNGSDYEACQMAINGIEAEHGPVDVLVNNAGITRDGTMHRMDFEQWNQVIQTNLSSCFNTSKAVIDGMRNRGFGRIVNIGSVNGQAGQYGQVNYAAAKSGIHGFTKALAQEGAAKGVTVNAIAPGYVETDMVRAVPENVLEKIVRTIPVGRLGQPEDIARSVLFLAADEAGFVTGSTLSINGGQHMY